MITGQEIIDFIHNCKLEDAPITRTCDELIFSKRFDTGHGTYEETSLHLNLQSGIYYKVNHSRKIYKYIDVLYAPAEKFCPVCGKELPEERKFEEESKC